MIEPKVNHPEQTDPILTVRKLSTTTILQSLASGSVAGAVEVGVNHPLWTIKTRMQCGEPVTFNLRLLYRGLLPNAVSVIPITGLQVGLDRCVQGAFFKDRNELTDSQSMLTAFVAGVGSAPGCCAAEMVLTHQKKTGGSYYAAGHYLVTNNGYRVLFTGLPATMIREGVFTAFFLAGTPILKKVARQYVANDYVASITAGIASGIGATIFSQGADTLKTIQQGTDAYHVGLRMAAKTIYAKQGIHGFFNGITPRGARVTSAVMVMGFVANKMEELFLDHDEEAILRKP